MFHVKHPGARVPPVRASASRSPAPPAPVASRAAPPTGWSPACAHAPSAISRLPRVCTPLCPPPLQRRRIALFPDVSRETPRASAPSIARPVPAFRFLVRMFHVKHSSRSRTACPGRVRARRAARDGEKASNSEEAARLRRPRRAVAEARLPVDQALCGRRVSGASGARRKTSEFDGFLPWGEPSSAAASAS